MIQEELDKILSKSLLRVVEDDQNTLWDIKRDLAQAITKLFVESLGRAKHFKIGQGEGYETQEDKIINNYLDQITQRWLR